jgi:hypothetical protein
MQIPYQPWIDWLKVLGMGIIIFGHSGGHGLIPPIFNPINFKQLGVCIFVFITAFTLANETRRPLQVIYNRYFEVFVLGLLLAMLLSVFQWFQIGDLNESNYLPFLLGLNVFWEDAFPANPTTWYVGTYLHLLIVWALVLRFLPMRWYVLAGLLCIEIGVRSVLMNQSDDFIAYMVFTSWMTVFFMGTFFGQIASRGDVPAETATELTSSDSPTVLGALMGQVSMARVSLTTRRSVALVLLAAVMCGWLAAVHWLGITQSNPFGRIPIGNAVTTSLLTSMAVTAEYAVYTLLLFALFVGIPANRFVSFLSRNTLFVFLAHMPFRDAATPYYYPWFTNGWVRQVANFVVLFVFLACVSHVIGKTLGLSERRKQIGRWLFGDRINRSNSTTPTDQ